MAMTPEKLDKVQKIYGLVNEDRPTTAGVFSVFRVMKKRIDDFTNAVGASMQAHKKEMKDRLDKHETDVASSLALHASQHDLDTLSKRVDDSVSGISMRIETLHIPDEVDLQPFDDRITALENKPAPTIPEPPVVPTLEDIRNWLESLQENDRLDMSAIRGLPEHVQGLITDEMTGIRRSVSSAAALHSLLDVNVVGIQTNQSIRWNGIEWVAYTPSSGGGATWYIGEQITLQGDNKTFTLANAPTSVINLTVDRQPQVNGLDYTGTINGTNKTFVFASAIDPSLASLIYADYS